jgi:6-pyruvoyltetrahydropterin/6-carboxytetrahydropterin synthase
VFTIRVEDSFAAAHYLSHFHGKCENLHGHNYRVRAAAQGETLGRGGMLLDFGVLKGALREVTGELDHSLLNEHPAFAEGDPSAELIARYIYRRLREQLPDAPLHYVEVFETEKNVARYSEA